MRLLMKVRWTAVPRCLATQCECGGRTVICVSVMARLRMLHDPTSGHLDRDLQSYVGMRLALPCHCFTDTCMIDFQL